VIRPHGRPISEDARECSWRLRPVRTPMDVPVVVIALVLYTVMLTVVDMVFDRRLLPRTPGRRRWLPHPDLIVLTLLVVALAVLTLGAH
jgi:hypothetical protein